MTSKPKRKEIEQQPIYQDFDGVYRQFFSHYEKGYNQAYSDCMKWFVERLNNLEFDRNDWTLDQMNEINSKLDKLIGECQE